jgi:hypothetical protein
VESFLVSMGDFKDLAGGIQAIVTALALFLGGGWALRKYVFRKEDYPRIDFTVDVVFVGQQEGEWLVELVGTLDNRGLVPHRIEELRFSVRTLTRGEKLTDGPAEIAGQVYFAKRLIKGSWLPAEGKRNMVIHPGVVLRYRYIYRLSPETTFVLLHGVLEYGRNRPEHRADRLVKVPAQGESPPDGDSPIKGTDSRP